ncbi:MAG: hypothetical protein HYU36_12415 [Planctomycetes bacterium]|nr:hypothetical protein [Planctomycetota bacterium]
MPARISFRVSTLLWQSPGRFEELLRYLTDFHDVVDDVAFFTGFTHPPLPLATIRAHAANMKPLLARFREAGFSAGINHLATLGHLDENLENSLRETWQHLVDIDGVVSKSCYCASDSQFLEYLRQAYRALAEAQPEFIWVDDDIRLESHQAGVTLACFCDLCLTDFSASTCKEWTREALREAFQRGPRESRLALRRQWLAHNRRYLARLLAHLRAAVDEVDPRIPLGLMTGETVYSGLGFDAFAQALAGPRSIEVKWRPGGGFYTDEVPSHLLAKAHSTGRQVSLLPPCIRDIQYEHENFPYQRRL